jgi:signal transduction histidine kinase
MPVHDARLEEMLGDAAGAVRATFDAMPQALGVLWPVRDEAGAVRDFELGYVNASGDAMMGGLAMRDEMGVSVLDAMPQMREMGVFDRLVEVATTGRPASAEIEMTGFWRGTTQMTGTYAHSVLPFGDAVLSLSHDLTEERRREAELRDFAAVAAHDLRDPLVALELLVNALGYQERAAGRDTAMIDEMRSAIHRSQRLVHGVLEYAGASTGMEVRERVDCGVVVQDVTQLLAEQIAVCGGEVRVLDMPVVDANADGVARVFQNLIANALKFRSEAPPRVTVSACEADDGWRFEVADNGVGLPDGQIFEMFSRGNGASQEGVGIGLAVCRRIVERHGGRIWGEPGPDGGSTFAFTLPQAERAT